MAFALIFTYNTKNTFYKENVYKLDLVKLKNFNSVKESLIE